jgi:acyl phosphate:glycerol-3-phosphate acyltransferase
VTLALVVLGYLCGAIPTGVLLGRSAGIDVRRAGSGNIGATNVARTVGARAGALTLVGDVLKGAVPVLIARGVSGDPIAVAASGLAALLGHVFPVTLGFSGGKGVSTGLGVLLVLAPLATAVGVVAFAIVLAGWRYVSLASVSGALAAAAAVVVLEYPLSSCVVSLLITAVIGVCHRDNFRRLVAGTEPPFDLHRKQAAPEN